MSFDPQVFDGNLFGAQSFAGLFDGEIFDSETFDTGEEVRQEQTVVSGGGTSALRSKRRVRARYRSSLQPDELEVIAAVAEAQVEAPAPEPIRRQQLTHALLEKSITVQEHHLVALEAERERIIGVAVAQYLRKLQEQEDDAFVMALAEAL